MLTIAAALAGFSTFAVIIEGVTLTNTLAGALAPILTALLFIPVRRIIRTAESNHELTKEESIELRRRLAEAEAAIRGDLRNGVKATVDRIETKVDKAAEPTTGESPLPEAG